MKLLIYSHFFAPSVGGVETFTMHLARAFGSNGDNAKATTTVVTQAAGEDPHDGVGQTFQTIRRPGAKRLWQLVGSTDKVILAGPAIVPLFFALLRRKPVILTHHGYQSICPNGLLFHLPTQRCCPGHFAARRYHECVKCNALRLTFAGSVRSLLLTFLRRGLSRLADSNVAVSRHVADRIGLPRAQVICNGVPVTKRMKGESATPQTDVCFAYVGRLVTEKGVSTLLDAAKLLRARKCRFRLLIIGDGPERESLQDMVSGASLNNEVIFEGFRTGSQLQAALAEVSAVVVPSIWEEPAPLSALEQMMEGRIIIGSQIGGLAEQIGDTGLMFEVGNPVALADQMARVIAERRSIADFGSRARERALNFYSLDRMLQEYRTLLAQI